MALYVEGVRCAVCNKPVSKVQEMVLFPSFVANKKDPLYIFNDAVCHSHCFDSHPLSNSARTIYDKTVRMSKTHNCVLCKNEIDRPDEYFCTGYIIDDESNPLFEYNFLQFHRSCLFNWSRFEEFRYLVEKYQISDKWEGLPILPAALGK